MLLRSCSIFSRKWCKSESKRRWNYIICFFGIFIINNFNRAPLHLAARLGNASIVEFLLSQKADPDVITVEKDNALHFAAQTGYVDIGQLLIKYTELINAKNSEGA